MSTYVIPFCARIHVEEAVDPERTVTQDSIMERSPVFHLEQQGTSAALLAMEVVQDLQNIELEQVPEIQERTKRRSAKPIQAVAQSIARIAAGGQMWARGAAAAIEVHKHPGMVEYEFRLALGGESRDVYENMNHILSMVMKFARVLLGMKIPEQEKATRLHKFASTTLLVPIVQLNQDRLLSLIENRIDGIKETWSSIRHALEDQTPPADTALQIMKLHRNCMDAWVKNISSAVESTDMQGHFLERAIEESWNILDRALTLPKNLEKLCENVEGQTTVEQDGTEDIWEEECDSEADLRLESTKMFDKPPKSSMLKVILALARYVSAGKCIVEWAYQSLQTLDQSGMTGNFKVSPVVGFDGDNESFKSLGIYTDLQEAFLALEYRLPDRQMIHELDVLWKKKLSYDLYVHAETQLVLFYVCNPHLCSGDIFIGTSKKLCIACTMMIEYLNKSFRKCRFMRGVRLVYKRTAHRPDCSWLFPRKPRVLRLQHMREEFDAIAHSISRDLNNVAVRILEESFEPHQGHYTDGYAWTGPIRTPQYEPRMPLFED